MKKLKIAFASDDTSETVTAVLSYLKENHEVIQPASSTDWPEMSVAVADSVVAGETDFGILMCWTGTGTAIAANKVAGIRAAQAGDPWIAENARRWNDANILTLSLKRLTPNAAVECVAAFLAVTEPDIDEKENIDKLAGK